MDIQVLINSLHLEPYAEELEKFSRNHPDAIHPFKNEILATLKTCKNNITKWHLLQMLKRLPFEEREVVALESLLKDLFHNSPSKIVKVESLQAAVDLSRQYPELKELAMGLYENALTSAIPSLKARVKRLKIQ
ncbi:MAG: hypothetical protein H6850_03100 [Alphaproteobacteria bacterium]|nr:MAG: hypothetical protein H6850_03100 [Alphaproteobacteria bacterium]